MPRGPPSGPPPRVGGEAGAEQHVEAVEGLCQARHQRRLAAPRAIHRRGRRRRPTSSHLTRPPLELARVGHRARASRRRCRAASAGRTAAGSRRRRLVLHHLVPERAQQVGGLVQGAHRRGRAWRIGGSQENAMRSRPARRARLRVGRSRWRLVSVSGATSATESRNSAASSTRRGPPSRRAEPVPVVLERRERHAAALGLEPEEAAARRRDADRAAAVRGERGPHEPCRHGRRGAAARAARGAVRAPGIAGDAPARRAERGDRELRQVRVADHHRAGRAQPPHHLGVGAGGRAGERVPWRSRRPPRRSCPSPPAAPRAAGDRRPRAAARPPVRLGQRALPVDDPEGVELRVDLGDPPR